MGIKNIYIFALAAHGQGISGSDRIFIETSRVLCRDYKVEIYVGNEGFEMCRKHHLEGENIKFHLVKIYALLKVNFFIAYIAYILKAIKIALTLRVDNSKQTIVYSASEFWMDSLPAFILKMRFNQIQWVAGWFQTAPNPVQGFNENLRRENYKMQSLLYWLIQLPIKPLIETNADLILVNNQSEVDNFNRLKNAHKIMVFLGAVNLEHIQQFKSKYKNIAKKYQAVFQGRFHPQKGVVELVDIWKKVVNKKPSALLAMIGDGPLMNNVKKRIKKLDLEKNIDLLGYLFDGPMKYKVFTQSQVVVHPSYYDSGGMAAAEAMAFNLPAVGYNLEAYQSYYPKGMLKVDVGAISQFASKIIELLDNKKLYKKVAQESKDMIQLNWSFHTKAEQLLKKINQYEFSKSY